MNSMNEKDGLELIARDPYKIGRVYTTIHKIWGTNTAEDMHRVLPAPSTKQMDDFACMVPIGTTFMVLEKHIFEFNDWNTDVRRSVDVVRTLNIDNSVELWVVEGTRMHCKKKLYSR